MIAAKIVADSVSAKGHRLTTMVVTFPRFILAELNTHRAFSRNSASSRAIPFQKMVKAVQENPFIPIAWQKDHKGMQGTEYLSTEYDHLGEHAWYAWLEARNQAVRIAKSINELGVTKQLCNRLLEPFMWHTAIISATDWSNFFKLRCPQYVIEGINNNKPFKSKKDVFKRVGIDKSIMHLKLHDFTKLDWLTFNKGQGEIHIMALAEAMWDALNESTPKQLREGEWHLPFGDNIDEVELRNQVGLINAFSNKELRYGIEHIKIAVARCARVSYTIVGEEGKPDNYAKDIELYDKLVGHRHSSPTEHVALCVDDNNYYANFKGFKQYRKILEEQNLL